MKTIAVNLGDDSYDLLIGTGLISQTGKRLKALGYTGKAVVITDSTVNELYGRLLEETLSDGGFETFVLTLPPGEKQKTLVNAGRLFTLLSDIRAERMTPILALGGGVIGDLAGFVAATYMRGVPLVQIPTTLLAQVDSSIGGKVAVDHGRLKNMVGAFYQPRFVIADTGVLKTLDARQFSNGLAEVIKYAVIKDDGFFTYLEKNIDRIISLDKKALEEIVGKSAEIKARIVEQDERDTGRRNILNFGHTVGHAIESISNFTVGHGEAVGIGMIAAAKISHRLGKLNSGEVNRIEKLIKGAGLPVKLPEMNTGCLLQVLTHDKKIAAGKIKYIIIEGIGKAVISSEVSLALIEQVLNKWQ